jgi:hypothetical protein
MIRTDFSINIGHLCDIFFVSLNEKFSVLKVILLYRKYWSTAPKKR